MVEEETITIPVSSGYYLISNSETGVFECTLCEYSCSRAGDLARHKSTRKHEERINALPTYTTGVEVDAYCPVCKGSSLAAIAEEREVILCEGSYYNGDKIVRCDHEIHLECLRFPELLMVPNEDFYCPTCPPPKNAANSANVIRTVSTQRLGRYLEERERSRVSYNLSSPVEYRYTMPPIHPHTHRPRVVQCTTVPAGSSCDHVLAIVSLSTTQRGRAI